MSYATTPPPAAHLFLGRSNPSPEGIPSVPRSSPWLVACAIFGTSGCAKHPYETALDGTAPLVTASSLAWIDQARDRVVYVTPADDEVRTTEVRLDEGDRSLAWALPLRDGSGLLAMMVPEDERQEEVDDKLVRLPADGDGDPVVYDVSAPFNAVHLSPDLRRAVLYFHDFGPSAGLHNANQVEIVELGSATAPRTLTLDGFGGRLDSVAFPAQGELGRISPVRIGDRDRDIVAFLASSEVVLADLDDATAHQVAVELGMGTGIVDGTLLRPGSSLYPDPALFLRWSAGLDVDMLTLIEKAADDGGEAGFTASVGKITLPGPITDFLHWDSPDTPYLVAIGDTRLSFTDVRTQGGFVVELGGAASRIYLRDHEGDSGPVEQVVAWAPGANLLHTLELGELASSLGRVPRSLRVDNGIGDLIVLDNDRALIGSGNSLYVVDLSDERVTLLESAVAYDARASALIGSTLYLGTAGQDRISYVDFDTLAPRDMVLDAPIRQFAHLPAVDKLVLVHDDPVGHATVVRTDGPSRGTSYVGWGFLVEGVLE